MNYWRSVSMALLFGGFSCQVLTMDANYSGDHDSRVRARDIGINPGVFEPGKLNAITDIEGVRVGQITLDEGEDIRTGVTAILPHGGNLYRDKVPAGFVAGNGYGKLMGSTQIVELGEIETPIALTNTLSVGDVARGVVQWTLAQVGNERIISVNAVVGETNDSAVNNIRAMAVKPEHVIAAIEAARSGPVEEGSVGAGRGTSAFGWKGGIGTSSRVLPESLGGWTVGVLVQSNYGGVLSMDGIPVGRELNQYSYKNQVEDNSADGSIIMVVATDAPLSDRNLERLARRALSGLARTGSSMSNGSGDYAISFSTAESVRRNQANGYVCPDLFRQACQPGQGGGAASIADLPNDQVSPLFLAAIEATEEAIYNSILMATSVEGYNPGLGKPFRLEAISIEKVKELIQRYQN